MTKDALKPGELFFTDEGSGSPVLFVHGWTCDSHDWAFQYDAFMARHRVILID
jgi:pimeloyl-ACP methyl ester carboxylesterase